MKTNDKMGVKALRLDIHAQPNDETCGPTCLQAVYNYYDDELSLNDTIAQVKTLPEGGTLAVMLGNHALDRGYAVTLYTYNLMMFDPSWFVNPTDLREKLLQQKKHKPARKFQQASDAYLSFLDKGGEIQYRDLNTQLIRSILNEGSPILTGLSATYLYNCQREVGATNQYDDLKGAPAGHFVVIHGYDENTKHVKVADPLEKNPLSEGQYYQVKIQRLINAILLGIVTYDANLLIIKEK